MDGTILADRYLLTEEIGAGGMGTVYRATDLRTGGPVAVKVPHPYLARDPVFRERLRREARIAAALTSPRVVRVVDLDEHEGVPYLVMEFVAGETLSERLRRAGPPGAEALAIAREIARALEAAHALGVVHRDLTPRNVKLVDGQLKVLDFGIGPDGRDDGDRPAGASPGRRLHAPSASTAALPAMTRAPTCTRSGPSCTPSSPAARRRSRGAPHASSTAGRSPRAGGPRPGPLPRAGGRATAARAELGGGLGDALAGLVAGPGSGPAGAPQPAAGAGPDRAGPPLVTSVATTTIGVGDEPAPPDNLPRA